MNDKGGNVEYRQKHTHTHTHTHTHQKMMHKVSVNFRMEERTGQCRQQATFVTELERAFPTEP